MARADFTEEDKVEFVQLLGEHFGRHPQGMQTMVSDRLLGLLEGCTVTVNTVIRYDSPRQNLGMATRISVKTNQNGG